MPPSRSFFKTIPLRGLALRGIGRPAPSKLNNEMCFHSLQGRLHNIVGQALGLLVSVS